MCLKDLDIYSYTMHASSWRADTGFTLWRLPLTLEPACQCSFLVQILRVHSSQPYTSHPRGLKSVQKQKCECHMRSFANAHTDFIISSRADLQYVVLPEAELIVCCCSKIILSSGFHWEQLKFRAGSEKEESSDHVTIRRVALSAGRMRDTGCFTQTAKKVCNVRCSSSACDTTWDEEQVPAEESASLWW